MSTEIDRVIAEISARDPRFADCIRGASAGEIAALEEVAGRALPPDYRAFLARMGHSSDWLRIEAADFRIETIARVYQAGLARAMAGYWLIGKATADPYADIYLHEDQDGAARVVSFPSPPRTGFEAFARIHLRPVAGSLPQLLALEAYRTFQLVHRTERCVLQGQGLAGGTLPLLDAAMAPAGLSLAWFSNDWVRVYDDAHLSAIAYEFPRCPCIVDLYADLVASLRHIEQRMKSILHTA